MRDLARHQELVDKIEGLLREYGDILWDEEEAQEYSPCPVPPDWNNPLSFSDWSLTVAVEDIEAGSDKIGYWTLHLEPPRQLPYRTRGLIETRLNY